MLHLCGTRRGRGGTNGLLKVLVLAAAILGVGAACETATDPAAEPGYVLSEVVVQVFVDLDESGDFTPGNDEAVAGAVVFLTRVDGEVRLQVESRSDGSAVFPGVPPGDYEVRIEPGSGPPDAILASPDVRMIQATADGGQIATRFRYLLAFEPIVLAKAASPGNKVRIRGTVTVEPGEHRAVSMYVQDETSGVQVFGLPSGTELSRGAEVTVRGERGVFRSEVQVVNPEIRVVGRGEVPEPRELSGARIQARTYEGELVRTRMVRIVAVDGGSAAAYNVRARAEDGTSFVVRVEARVPLDRADWEIGAGYDLTGVLGVFDFVAQLKPRGPDDLIRVADPVDVGEPPVSEIAPVRALVDGERVAVEGVVTVGHRMFRNQGDNVYLQDSTGGLQVFGGILDELRLRVGDSIRVSGVMDTWHERQIASPEVEVLGTGRVPGPVVLEAAAFNSLDHEGELVRINNVEVLQVGASDDQGRYNVVVRGQEGEMQIRVEGGVAEIFPREHWTVGVRYHVIGALGQFLGTAQLKVRMAEDVEPA